MLKKIKKILKNNLILSIFIIFPCYSQSNFDSIVDIPPNHWAYSIVKEVIDDYHILTPFPDHTFRGNKEFTRYEFAASLYEFIKLIERYSNVTLKLSNPLTLKFNDISDSHWARNAVYTLVNEYGLFENIVNNNFNGNDIVKRVEVAEILYQIFSRAIEYKIIDKFTIDNAVVDTFSDISSNDTYYPAIKNVVDYYGIMVGYPDGTFKPYLSLNRYQFAAIIYNAMLSIKPAIEDKKIKLSTIQSPKPPLEETKVEVKEITNLSNDKELLFRQNTPFNINFSLNKSSTTNKIINLENFDVQYYPFNFSFANSFKFSHNSLDLFGNKNTKFNINNENNDKLSLYLDDRFYIGYPFKIINNLTLNPYIGGRIKGIYRLNETFILEGTYGLYWGGLLNWINNNWHIYLKYGQTILIKHEFWTPDKSISETITPHVIHFGELGLDYYLSDRYAINLALELEDLGIPHQNPTDWNYYTFLYGIKVGLLF